MKDSQQVSDYPKVPKVSKVMYYATANYDLRMLKLDMWNSTLVNYRQIAHIRPHLYADLGGNALLPPSQINFTLNPHQKLV